MGLQAPRQRRQPLHLHNDAPACPDHRQLHRVVDLHPCAAPGLEDVSLAPVLAARRLLYRGHGLQQRGAYPRLFPDSGPGQIQQDGARAARRSDSLWQALLLPGVPAGGHGHLRHLPVPVQKRRERVWLEHALRHGAADALAADGRHHRADAGRHYGAHALHQLPARPGLQHVGCPVPGHQRLCLPGGHGRLRVHAGPPRGAALRPALGPARRHRPGLHLLHDDDLRRAQADLRHHHAQVLHHPGLDLLLRPLLAHPAVDRHRPRLCRPGHRGPAQERGQEAQVLLDVGVDVDMDVCLGGGVGGLVCFGVGGWGG
eukprot:m.46987 g.46987  ORF g.46987 m.46987 type:complete len:315 (+) comp12595_c0_seq1:149-1093(+)